MVNTIFLKKRYTLLTLLLLLITIEGQQFPIQPVAAVSNTYTEDFNTTTYLDAANTTTEGWGSGTVSLSRKNPVFEGSLETTNATGIFITRYYAYLADQENGLLVVNITDSTSPTLAGSYNTPGLANNVFIQGDFAYVADNTSLQILNIKNPSKPFYVGNYTTSGSPVDVFVDGNLAYVADYDGGFKVINVTVPTVPTLAGSYMTLDKALNVKIIVDQAYVTINNEGLLILDISDPTNPAYQVSYNTTGTALGVSIAGKLAYIADGENGLTVINITNRNNSTLGNCQTPAIAQDVTIFGDFAYVVCKGAGLQVVNIKDPSKPQIVGFYDTNGSSMSSAVYGNHICIADGFEGLQILKISDLMAPAVVGSLEPPADYNYALGVTVCGDRAYVAYDASPYGFIQIIDISNPTDPTLVDTYGNNDCFDIKAVGEYLFFVTDLYFVMKNSSTLDTIGWANIIDDGRGFDVQGNYAYVAARNGLYIINISESPFTVVGTYSTTAPALDVAVEGEFAYLAADDDGLLILDITDPTNPTLASSAGFQGSKDVDVEGDVVYVTAGATFGELYVINITNPYSLQIYSVNGVGYANGVAISGDFAYLADGPIGLTIMNVSTLGINGYVAKVGTTNSQAVTIAGDYAYIADREGGFKVVQISRNKVHQFYSSETAQSTIVAISPSDTLIVNATLSSSTNMPSNTSIQYFLSADDGLNWDQVTLDTEHMFTYPGTKLKWKSVLSTIIENATPFLHSVSLDFSYIVNPIVLLTPSTDNFTSDNTPTFTWISSLEAASYLLQLDTSSDFDSGNLISYDQSASLYTIPSALTDDTWFWRVAVIDSDGDQGFFSSPWSVVVDTTSPTINDHVNISYAEGTSGQVIWNPSDNYPLNYTITRDGVNILNGSWAGESLSINESLPFGHYSYTCTVYDQAGSFSSDVVGVIVYDNTVPTIDTPVDIIYMETETGYTIIWNALDLNPEHYTITRNGAEIASGEWNSTTPISINVEGLSAGTYLYSIVVNDSSSFSNTDTVIVTVTAIPTTSTPSSTSSSSIPPSTSSSTTSPSSTTPSSTSLSSSSSIVTSKTSSLPTVETSLFPNIATIIFFLGNLVTIRRRGKNQN